VNAPNLSPGTAVAGKYQIRALMGHTGASATYRAVAQQGYEVALKLFSPAVAQRPDIMQMIERIYAETNGLTPDLIVPIIDAGYDPATGAPFGATQIVPMSSLSEIVKRRPLAPGETAAVIKSVGRVLDNAHIREIMHHALKPTNIFVEPSQGMAVRVMDFGANIPRSIVPTHEGYAHSAPWMAPEQITGTVPAGPPADVFATALVAFYALTGTSYWRSCQGPAPDVNAWQQELLGPRTPASARAAELGLRISPSLDAVFSRALAHEPHERFRTVGEFAATFEAALGAREPEMATTMAFPAVSDAQGPPQGMGGYGPPPGIGGGGAQPQGGGGDGGYPPPPVPYTGAAAYTATIPSSTHAIPPNPGPQPLPQRSASGKLAPIMVGAVAVLLVGGAIGAWVIMGRTPPPETGPIAVTPQGTGASTAMVAPGTAAQTAEPAPTAAQTAEPAAPAGVEAKITCSPACEEISVDGQKVEDMSKPLMLTPGEHKIALTKSGYKTQEETISIAEGKPFSKEFKLTAEPKAVAANPNPTPAPTPKTTTTTPKPTGGTTAPTRKCGKLIKTNCVK
jgi:hypothetical protein